MGVINFIVNFALTNKGHFILFVLYYATDMVTVVGVGLRDFIVYVTMDVSFIYLDSIDFTIETIKISELVGILKQINNFTIVFY